MTKRSIAFGVLVTCLAGIASAGPVKTGWIPSNAGVLWWQNDATYPVGLPDQPPGEADGAWYITRRIAASPHRAGVMHMGSFFHGIYASAGGGAWATLTPGCWLPVNPPKALEPAADGYRIARRAAIAATGLDACGIESVVYDPVLPSRIYASAYDVVALNGYDSTLGDGGVYVSDDLGVTWRRLLGGLRGNGLAVHRSSATAPATIAVGYIQQYQTSVGPTPGGGSVSVSTDDGKRWTHSVLPSSGCSDAPETSQRVTPTIAISPTDPNRIFLGTNAGLYESTNGGQSFVARKILCRGVWGIALAADGKTIYAGDANGVVWRAPTATMSFSQIASVGGGKIQSLLLDARDEQWLYAASWTSGAADGRVWRVNIASGSATRLDDSVLSQTNGSWPQPAPKPFPLVANMANGRVPSLFLAQSSLTPDGLWVSTLVRGAYVRFD